MDDFNLKTEDEVLAFEEAKIQKTPAHSDGDHRGLNTRDLAKWKLTSPLYKKAGRSHREVASLNWTVFSIS